MMETLYLRLGTQANDNISWLVTDDQHKEIIASGELPGAEQLTQLTEKAQGRQVIALVNAAAMKFSAITVPGRSRRAIELAAPYAIEDDLAQDVDELFFAYADKPRGYQGEENCFFVAVDREQLMTWQAWLADAELFCQTLVPDVLALPWQQVEQSVDDESVTLSWSAIAFGNELLLRQQAWQGCVLDSSITQIYFEQSAAVLNENETALAVHHYTPMSEDDFSPIADVTLVHQPEELPLFVLAKTARSASFNLLQGEFQVKKKHSPVIKNWLLVAGIAAFALLLNLTHKGLLLMQLKDEYEQVNAQVVKSYKKAFPRTKRVQVSLVRSQLQRSLQEFSGGGSGEGFLAMLDDIRPAFQAHKNIKPQQLKYDSKRSEIRLNIAADNYLSFDRFKTALEQEQLVVTTGAQNNQGDEVTGSFTIRYN